MPRTKGAKDKKKRNINWGKVANAAVIAGSAGLMGVGNYLNIRDQDRMKRIDRINALMVNETSPSVYREKLYKEVKEGGRGFQKVYRKAIKATPGMPLETKKKIRSDLLQQYRRETGLETAVDKYRAARKHASVGDLKGQSKAGKKVIKRQLDALRETVKKVGDRRKLLILSDQTQYAKFARKVGAKDKKKRKSRRNLIIGGSVLGTGGLVGVGGYIAGNRPDKPKVTIKKETIPNNPSAPTVRKGTFIEKIIGKTSKKGLDLIPNKKVGEMILNEADKDYLPDNADAQVFENLVKDVKQAFKNVPDEVYGRGVLKIGGRFAHNTKEKIKKGIADRIALGWRKDSIAKKQAVRDAKLAGQKAWRIIRYGKNLNM